jgi:hypothetical protein
MNFRSDFPPHEKPVEFPVRVSEVRKMGTRVKTVPATSKDVRTWFEQNPKKVPAGAEVSVRVSCKGRIKPEAIEVFNEAAKSHGMRYDEGAPKMMPLTYKARNHRMVTTHLPRTQVRALAGKAGTRGPLSKADLDFAAEMFLAAK